MPPHLADGGGCGVAGGTDGGGAGGTGGAGDGGLLLRRVGEDVPDVDTPDETNPADPGRDDVEQFVHRAALDVHGQVVGLLQGG